MKIFNYLLALCMTALLVACGGGGGGSSNGGASVPVTDTTAPSVISTSPTNGTTNVAIGSAITATFSEAMNATTLTAATFTVSGVTGTVTYTGTTVTFTPTSPLAYGTTYTAMITTGARDTAGNALATNATWSFTTAPNPAGATPPAVSSTNPANGATNVAIGTSITATFSEAMNATTLNAATFTVSGIAGSITYSGTTATFTPTSPLAYSTTYTATITTGARSATGAAMASNVSWTFTTAPIPPDVTPPALTSTFPARNATNVGINVFVMANFSEPMNASTLNAATFTLSGITGTIAYSGTTATFTPSTLLAYGTSYTATITTGAKDAAGNALTNDYSWTFTTGPNPDVTPPTVISTSPVNGATNVAINAPISASFSEAMNATTLTASTFTLNDAAGAPVAGTVSYAGAIATFTAASNLAYASSYTATISTGVKDLAGNALTTARSWNFTTGKKINGLGFRVIDAEYSKALNKVIMVSSTPANQLHIYDPVANQDLPVALNLPPTSVSVSPDGLFAAIGHNAYISYVNLTTATLLSTLPVTADISDIVLAGNGYAYAFPRIDQWVQIHAVNLATGAESLSTAPNIRAGTRAKLHPGGTAIYGADNGLSPSEVQKYDISTGAPVLLYDSPYHGDYPMCGDLWMSEDGLRIFTKCGNVFRATSSRTDDITYNGALQNLGSIMHLSHSSAIGKVIAIPANTFSVLDSDTEIRTFAYDFLTFEQSVPLPRFIIGSRNYVGHGRFVFYNSDASKTFVVLQADSTSGAIYDYGVVTY